MNIIYSNLVYEIQSLNKNHLLNSKLEFYIENGNEQLFSYLCLFGGF